MTNIIFIIVIGLMVAFALYQFVLKQYAGIDSDSAKLRAAALAASMEEDKLDNLRKKSSGLEKNINLSAVMNGEGNKQQYAFDIVDHLFVTAGMENYSKVSFFFFNVGMAFVAAFIIKLLLQINIITALVLFVVLSFTFPILYLNYRSKKRLAEFAEEFVNAVEIVSRSIKAGISLNECIDLIAKECKDPVGYEFKVVKSYRLLGMTTEQAVKILIDRVPLTELTFFSVVLNLQTKSGGGLGQPLDNLAEMIRERKKLARKVRVLIASAKTELYVFTGLPIFFVGYVLLMKNEMLVPMLYSPIGLLFTAGILTWAAIGYFIMYSITKAKF